MDKENTQITERPWLASMAGVVLLFAGAGALLGQGQPTVTNSQTLTRAEEIDQAREAKSRQLQPEVPTPGEQRFVRIVRDLDALFGGHDGVRLGLGGLAGGLGFAAGPDWKRTEMFDGNLNLHASARGATSKSYLGRFHANLPNLFNGLVAIDFDTLHQNLAQVPYYGPGPRSRKTGRSAYRLEETSLVLQPALRPNRRILVGATGGVHFFNVGPGDTDTYISTNAQFPASITPGIDRQGSFWQSGVFARYARLRGGSEPISGTRVEVEYNRFSDRTFSAFSHGRIDVEVQQYIPLFNDSRVIALRGHTTLTDSKPGQSVPFYLQPHVGGPTTLRGFRPFRFYDDNALFLNGEYRIATSIGLDFAIFAEGGKVFPDWGQLNLSRLEGSFGGGFRVKARQNLLMRLDVGASREGVMVWFRFDNIF